MKKRLVSLVLAVVYVMISVICVQAEPYYRPGPTTYDLESHYCIESKNVKLGSANQIEAKTGGVVRYDYYIAFDVKSIEIFYEASSKGEVAVEPEGSAAQTLKFTPDSESVTYTFENAQRSGDHFLTLKFSGEAKISKIRLHAQGWADKVAKNQPLAATSDEEHQISTAVLMKLNSPMLMVNGGRRYINEEDVTERLITVDGKAYLPIKTLALALGYYHEDLPDKQYCLLRIDQTTYTWRDGKMYKQFEHEPLTEIDVQPYINNGKIYMPVRYFGEELGKTVGFKDGIIVIEGRNYAKKILEDNTLFEYVKSKFKPFDKATQTGNTYHVAQTSNASDNNPGTESAPFRTLNKAGEVATAGDTVIVHQGVYREIFTPQNDGTETSPITFKAADGEKVTIAATEKISTFADMGKGVFAASMPCDLGFGRNQIFYNGECIVEARYPNDPKIPMSEVGEKLSDLFPIRGDFLVCDTDKTLVTSDTLLNQDEKNYWKGATYVSMHGNGWTLNTAVVESSEKGKLHLTKFPTRWWYDPADSNHADWGYLTGSINCMDLPGEWVIQNGVLLIIPPEGETAESLELEVKARHLVMDLAERKFVRVEGMNTIGGSILMNNAEMCTLDNMNIRYVSHFTWADEQREGFLDDYSVEARLSGEGAPQRGEDGIYVGGTDNRILNSVIDHSAAAGMLLSGTYAYIENNIVSNCGYMGTYVSGITGFAEPWKEVTTPRGGFALYYNTVYNSGRSVLNVQSPEGISKWSSGDPKPPYMPYEVAYNDFHDGILFSLDTGITYEYNINASSDRRMSKMHNNYVYYTLPETNPFSFGLYHDGNAIGVDTWDNIIFTTEKDTMFTQGYVFDNHDNNASATWNNMMLKSEPVAGGPDNLQLRQFPYGLPFYAGSRQGKDEFLRNYNKENENFGLYKAKDAILTDAEVDEYGSVAIQEKTDLIEFKDVDMTEDGKNTVEIYFRGDRYKNVVVYLDLGFGDSVETAEFYPISVKPSATETYQLDVEGIDFSTVTGKTNVYLRTSKGQPIAISGITFGKKDVLPPSHDGSLIYGGEFDRVDAAGSTIPSAVYQIEGQPHAKDLWGGTTIRYSNVTVKEDSDVLYINIGTGESYAGQEVIVSYNIPGQPGKTEIGRTVTTGNGWYANEDTVYIQLDEPLPARDMDIYVEFVGSGTCNFYSFGFISDIPQK